MSFEPETEVVELESRLGRVGSIQAWNPWKSRRSVDDAKWWVSKIARLSHGLGEADDYVSHFDRVVNQMHHESILEFVPFLCVKADGSLDTREHLPAQSVRGFDVELLDPTWFSGEAWTPTASAFLVECPIFVARQWVRHRAFAYLEMSRRSVKGIRVPFTYYGKERGLLGLVTWARRRLGEFEYNLRIRAGQPAEVARKCLPLELMTKFWVAGFDRDWRAFLALRNDPHAQSEIRVFAQWIESYLAGKNCDAK